MNLIDRFPLPDPTKYLRVNFWRPANEDAQWLVVAHPFPERPAGGTFWQPRSVTVWSTPDEEDARATSVELQEWIILTRKLMDLST